MLKEGGWELSKLPELWKCAPQGRTAGSPRCRTGDPTPPDCFFRGGGAGEGKGSSGSSGGGLKTWVPPPLPVQTIGFAGVVFLIPTFSLSKFYFIFHFTESFLLCFVFFFFFFLLPGKFFSSILVSFLSFFVFFFLSFFFKASPPGKQRSPYNAVGPAAAIFSQVEVPSLTNSNFTGVFWREASLRV